MRVGAAVALLLMVFAAVPVAAHAGWSRSRLMSASGDEQAIDRFPISEASNRSQLVGPPAVSADGRYAAFDSRAQNLLISAGPAVQADAEGGIFRRDVDSGALDIVALAAAPGASARSVRPVAMSADGRQVAFSTARPLVPGDVNGRTDVYVRDMAQPDRFTLASSGTSAAGATLPSSKSLSADGRRLLVVEEGTLTVRDLDSGARTIITTSLMGGLLEVDDNPVALSPDGSTVVWLDANPRDVASAGQYLGGERPLVLNKGETNSSTNPWDVTADLLWRRVGDPTVRRVVAGGDNEDPACAAGSVLAQDDPTRPEGVRGPCDGPFSFSTIPPSPSPVTGVDLSTSGDQVAVVFGGQRRDGGTGAELFLRDMAGAGGRKATTRQLTAFAGGDASGAVDISASGRVIAFVADTDASALPAPTFVGTGIGRGAQNVYAMDLDTQTFERVTRAYTSDPADGNSANAAISGTGDRMVLRSEATNLLFGDFNANSDVFVADRFDDRQPPLASVGATSAPPAETEIAPVWRLSATVSRGGRTLYVDVRVPAAGRVTASARRVRVRVRGRTRVAPVLVTRGRVDARQSGAARVRLRLPQRYRRTARGKGGLPVRITVQFKPARAGSTLTRTLDSRFTTPSAKR